MSKWPPDYDAEFIRRAHIIDKVKEHPDLAEAYYSHDAIAFINDLCFTVDPRTSISTFPFVLFPRQVDFVLYINSLIENKCNGLVEKSRDMGATWIACAYSIWLWRFRNNAAIGFGSRKHMLVDRLGDMDSIFEKMRFIIRMLPIEICPKGFDISKHCPSMKILNPENGSSITGESGDNIGRGGRKLIYWKDESSHYERPKKIESALMDNTDIQVDISSVNGTGNVFHRKRVSGSVWKGKVKNKKKVQVFIFDWSHHPLKTKKWYNNRRKLAEEQGLLAEFAREVDRDYSAAITGTIIKRHWVEAAIGLAEDMGIEISGKKRAGLDVADDGLEGDSNALSIQYGIQIDHVESWGQVDTDITAKRAYNRCLEYSVEELQYDSIGVGAGVKGSINSMKREGESKIKVVSWVASGKVVNPGEHVVKGDEDGPLNKNFFKNFKAQSWWRTRNRFYQAWKCRQGLEYDKDELISINRNIDKNMLVQLTSELCQPTRKESSDGKMVIDKSPEGSLSPNIADSVIIANNAADVNDLISQELMI